MFFLTTDGYRLHRVDDCWADQPDLELADMVFLAGPDGLPVDTQGQAVGGKLVEGGTDV